MFIFFLDCFERYLRFFCKLGITLRKYLPCVKRFYSRRTQLTYFLVPIFEGKRTVKRVPYLSFRRLAAFHTGLLKCFREFKKVPIINYDKHKTLIHDGINTFETFKNRLFIEPVSLEIFHLECNLLFVNIEVRKWSSRTNSRDPLHHHGEDQNL